MTRGAFYQHLSDAIALNTRRRPYYACRTGGRSRALSTMLIAAERALLPFAALVDAWALPFQREGVPIVRSDFVSMDGATPADTPPRHAATMTTAHRTQLLARLRRWRRTVITSLLHTDLEAVCKTSHALLVALDGFERAWRVHVAMCRHLVESAALAALHGIDYAAATNGRTYGLTRVLVGGQAAVATWAVHLDERAQALHRDGVGILVNDLPPIPFRREWTFSGTDAGVTNEQGPPLPAPFAIPHATHSPLVRPG